MAHSLSQIYVHLVFHVKTQCVQRQHLSRVWAYIAGVCRGVGSYVVEVGGEPDHVHVLCTLPRTSTVADLAEEVKRNSSHWIKSLDIDYAHFAWQRGYAIFSISQSKLTTVKNYILNQEKHHKKISFQEEYEQWLKEYAIDYDPKYLWTD